MKPIKVALLQSIKLAIEDFEKNGDECRLKQKLGGIKGKYPLTYRNTLNLEK